MFQRDALLAECFTLFFGLAYSLTLKWRQHHHPKRWLTSSGFFGLLAVSFLLVALLQTLKMEIARRNVCNLLHYVLEDSSHHGEKLKSSEEHLIQT
jgi:hypothetical protein